ncbi:hypothetical protein M378DRAFT_287526 [Amanita muscaria Koide BX008]|uniref:Uncharacterized protein n=1 Tax=Amanita muscaria (strain Koide BX008) TaxID=946122 RepID=A0A0C2S820_AMAMK|nr:hypothetical protein M378DRAFT_287526 [Amanita muscaria Koide BX008]
MFTCNTDTGGSMVLRRLTIAFIVERKAWERTTSKRPVLSVTNCLATPTMGLLFGIPVISELAGISSDTPGNVAIGIVEDRKNRPVETVGDTRGPKWYRSSSSSTEVKWDDSKQRIRIYNTRDLLRDIHFRRVPSKSTSTS